MPTLLFYVPNKLSRLQSRASIHSAADALNLLHGNQLNCLCMFVFVVMFKEEKILPGADVVNVKETTESVDMRSINASAEEVSTKTAEGCVSMCGICPTCVFASSPPGSSRCLWKVSDEFKRRFALTLLLRCRSVQVLESIQGVLRGATSWTLHTYARSRSPITPQEHPFRFSHLGHDGKPLGVNQKEIWKWFSSSPDWVKSSYVCRIFSLCDSELLRMVANLTNVLLVRQKSGFLEFNGKISGVGKDLVSTSLQFPLRTTRGHQTTHIQL